MIILIFSLLYTVQLIVQSCNGLHLIDLPLTPEAYYRPKNKLDSRARHKYEPYPRIKGKKVHLRRHWQVADRPDYKIKFKAQGRRVYEDEKDATLKQKIAMLVKQTMNEAEEKMKDVKEIKEQFRKEKHYRAGFVISMVKKSREVLNELFNVAVKHRDEWLALEQLKIFELIVHTNIDTTNFLKQLVEIEEGRDTFEIPDSFKIEKPGDKTNEKPQSDPSDPSDSNKTPSDPSDPDKIPLDPNIPQSDPSDPDKTPPDPNIPQSDPSHPDKNPPDPNIPQSDPSDPDKKPHDPKKPQSDPSDPSDSNKTPSDPSDPDKKPPDPNIPQSDPSDSDKTPPDPNIPQSDPSDPDKNPPDPNIPQSDPSDPDKKPPDPNNPQSDPSDPNKKPAHPNNPQSDPSDPHESAALDKLRLYYRS